MKENNYIYTNRTAEYKERVENIINNSKKIILDFFEFKDDGRFNFNIYIYDTKEELVKEIRNRGFKNDPDYMCACQKDEDNSLNFYEPEDESNNDYSKNEYDNVIFHELIHGIQYKIYGKHPEWLAEGIAKYLDGTYKKGIEYLLTNYINKYPVPSMHELINEFGFHEYDSYDYAYLMISYLIEIEGKSEFIKSLYDNNYIKGLENRDLIDEAINYYINKFNTKVK